MGIIHTDAHLASFLAVEWGTVDLVLAELPEANAEAPDVDRLVVAAGDAELWRTVIWRAHAGGVPVLAAVGAEPEVCHDEPLKTCF